MQTVEKNTITRYKNGDAEAFDELFNHYSKKIYRIALGLLKDEHLAEDIVQDVFIKLWIKRERVNPELTFDNYLFTIAYNSIRNVIRQHSIKNKTLARLLDEAPKIIQDTDAELIYSELFELASRTIEKLPPKRKAIYKLSRQEGLKIHEIADRYNISTRTVESHLTKALKYLKEELTRHSLLSLLFFYLFLK